MTNMNRLFKAITQMGRTATIKGKIRAKLGDGADHLQAFRPDGSRDPGMVWARVEGLGICRVRCRKVTQKYGWPVLVEYSHDGVLEVVGEDGEEAIRFAGERGGDVGPHRWSHDLLGPDPDFVAGLRLKPLLCRPTNTPSLSVYVEPYSYEYAGTRKTWPGGELDLTSEIPSTGSEQVLIVVCLNPVTNALTYYTGTVLSPYVPGATGQPFTATNIDAIDTDATWQVAAIRAYNGQTQFLWPDWVADRRDWIGAGPDLSAYVQKSLFDANTILAANSDNTPAAVTVAEDRILGRKSGGNITALTGAEVSAIIGVSGVAAYEDGVSIVAAADKLDFKDAFDVVDAGSNDASIYLKLHDYVGGRLTLESGVPVSITDQTAKTNVYYTPYTSNLISLYDGTRWRPYTFSQITISVPATTGTNYDVFVYDSSGVTAEAVAWTNDTTRATALATQDGRLVKTGATGRRYVGTFRTTGVSGQTEDSMAARLMWNYHNRIPRKLAKTETTNSWTYATQTWRSANNSTANRVQVVVGVAEIQIDLSVAITANANVTGYYALPGIAEDATNTNDVTTTDMGHTFINALASTEVGGVYTRLLKYPALGYHYYQWTEIVQTGATGTFYSQAGLLRQSGILGTIEG